MNGDQERRRMLQSVGFPVDAVPYRSFGIEPRLGSSPGLTGAGSEGAAVLPGTGALAWRVKISSAVPPEARRRD